MRGDWPILTPAPTLSSCIGRCTISQTGMTVWTQLREANLFATACFHRPDELRTELEDAGLVHLETLAIEGPDWIVPEFEERWKDERQREVLLQVVRWMERESAALGMSPHLMAVAQKHR